MNEEEVILGGNGAGALFGIAHGLAVITSPTYPNLSRVAVQLAWGVAQFGKLEELDQYR